MPATATLVRVAASAGFSFAQLRTSLVNVRTLRIKLFSGGSRTLPISIPNAATPFFNNLILFADVAARAAYSFSMEPAYWLLSATKPRFFSRALMLVSSGAIALNDSLPNKSERTEACLYLSKAAICFNTMRVVPLASFCMSFATLP